MRLTKETLRNMVARRGRRHQARRAGYATAAIESLESRAMLSAVAGIVAEGGVDGSGGTHTSQSGSSGRDTIRGACDNGCDDLERSSSGDVLPGVYLVREVVPDGYPSDGTASAWQTNPEWLGDDLIRGDAGDSTIQGASGNDWLFADGSRYPESGPARAPINYGDFNGPTVEYLDVVETGGL